MGAKHLGHTVSGDLSWNTCFRNITSKANRPFGFNKRNIYVYIFKYQERVHEYIIHTIIIIIIIITSTMTMTTTTTKTTTTTMMTCSKRQLFLVFPQNCSCPSAAIGR